MSKIEVRLNPDVSPSGSDLAVVNAARRSFNTRSEWDFVETNGPEDEMDELLFAFDMNYKKERVLKDKDKRLIEFLARGMTADDFESFCDDVDASITDIDRGDLKEKLWEWRNTPTHDTPIDHCHMSFEVKAPIFVARQLV